MKVKIVFFLLLLPLFLILPSISKAYASSFTDDFSKDLSKWEVKSNNCRYESKPSEWKIENGKLGIKIDGGNCYTDISPTDKEWGEIGDNYIAEFDMLIGKGTDHHFAFRYKNPNSWYNFHIQSPNVLVLQMMKSPPGGYIYHGDFSEGKVIHFKVVVYKETLKIYIGSNPEELLVYNPDMGAFHPTGKIALQGTAGGDPISETWFDNVVVNSIPDNDISLMVPPIKQTGGSWGGQVYDSADIWSPVKPTISDWGCALTSAAMILNFYGINKFPDGTDINPGTLNSWLKTEKDGYVENGFVNWLAISRLSKIAGKSDNNPKFKDKSLELQINNNDKDLLSKDIKNYQPDILDLSNHFVVAKGISGDTFEINDPYYDYTNLKDGYEDKFYNMIRYVPSYSDLSYMMITSPINTNIKIFNNNGNQVGFPFTNTPLKIEKGDSFNSLGQKIYYLPKPDSGEYKLEAASETDDNFPVSFYFYNKDGEVTINNFKNTSIPLNSRKYNITFDKNDNLKSKATRTITIDEIIEDINALRELNHIKNKVIYNTLLITANNIKKDLSKNRIKFAIGKIKILEIILRNTKGIGIDKIGIDLLLEDLDTLKSNLK